MSQPNRARIFSHVPVISCIVYSITGIKSQIPSISDTAPNWVPSVQRVHPVGLFYSVIQRQSYIQLFGCRLRFAQFSQFILSYDRFLFHATKKKGKRGLECHSKPVIAPTLPTSSPHRVHSSPHPNPSTLSSPSSSTITKRAFLLSDFQEKEARASRSIPCTFDSPPS